MPAPTSTDRVVDIGAGTGLLGLALLDDIGELVLAEPSDGMLAVIAEKLAAADLPQVTAVKLDLVADPPPGNPFDLAVSFLVLHHIKDTAAALAGVRRLLRPGAGWRCPISIPRTALPQRRGRRDPPPRVRPGRPRGAGPCRRLRRRRARSAIDIEDEGRHYPAFLLLGRNP